MGKQTRDRRVLVTGGGTGIGREIALSAAERGAAVAINYARSRDDAEGTVRDLRALGARAGAFEADIARDEEARRLVEEALAFLGGLDLLVNNAGVTRFVAFSDLEALEEDDWDRLWTVNVKGAFYVARAARAALRASGTGHIVNIASVAGITGAGSSIPYCASKAALISLTKSLARALAPEIRVNAVAPGFTDTRWNQGRDDARLSSARQTPLGRVATPRDVALAVASLDEGGLFVTGQVLVVDGGRTL